MAQAFDDYLTATRHPWAALLFVGPLLAVYELGCFVLADRGADTLRNGADAWMRTVLAQMGMSPPWAVPALLLAMLLTLSLLRRHDRPGDSLGLWSGMAVEGFLFAVLLYALSRGLGAFLGSIGIMLESVSSPAAGIAGWFPLSARQPGSSSLDPSLEQILSYLGAGIYEETLFRLLLFSGLLWIFHLADFPWRWAVLLAGLASALLFAAAHNLGPGGEPFDEYIFLFRTLAGLYFAVLYHLRGFGIAVGAHAGYDVLVGVLVREV